MALCLLNMLRNSIPFLGTNLFAQVVAWDEKHNVREVKDSAMGPYF